MTPTPEQKPSIDNDQEEHREKQSIENSGDYQTPALGEPAERIPRLDTIKRSSVVPRLINLLQAGNISFLTHLITSGYPEVGTAPRVAIGTAAGAYVFHLLEKRDQRRNANFQS